MKKHLLIILCCITATISANAQSAASYAFTQTSGTYADLTSPTNIYAFSSSWDDNVSSSWNIGFTFNYCGTGYSTFNICANGWITFSTIGSNTYTPLSVKTNAIAPLGGDLWRSTAGFVSYLTTGSSPNRVCTIQWKDVCHFNTVATGPLNFQIRLYETTNVIEFIYGAFSPTATTSYTYHVGINGATTGDYNNRSTTSNWASTTAGTSNTASCTQSNTIKPTSGLIFRWTPPCTLPSITGSDVCVGATSSLSNTTSGGTWASSATAVATINSAGVATGVSAGVTNITYTVASCAAIRTLTVNPAPVATAIATPSVICAGGSTTLNVTATNPGAAYGLSSVTFSPVSFTPTGTLNSGTTPTTGSNDDGYYTVSIPFTFSFYGNSYTSCNIGTNGYVMFGGGVTSTYINAIPNTTFPATLSLFGRDMDLRLTGSITYGTTGTTPNRKFIISYNSVPDYSSGVPETGQIVIYETSGDVEYHITTAQATTHSIGIQSGSGAASVVVPGHNNAAAGLTNTAYKFSMPMPSVAWASDPTLSSLTIANPTTSALSAAKTYTVVATASNGCKGFTTVSVNVSPSPAALTGTTTICQTGTTTLTSTAGGTWASSNTAVATVVTGTTTTGVVTGVSAGSATISYFFGASCYVTQSVTVLPTAPVTGPSAVCPGLTITMSNALSGGTWSSSNTTLATVNASTGVVTGVAAGTPNIIYTLPTTCARFATITVNPLPAPFIGTTTVCKGLDITLTESSTGGVWSSGSTAIAVVGSATTTTGVVTGISAGTTFITYTLPTSCIRTTSVLVNPLPVPITAPPGSCVTNILNPAITLVDGTPLGTWSSSNTSVASIISFSGVLTGLVPGTANITYTLPTGCIATTPITINPLPAAISGTTVVCANAVTYLSNPDLGGVWKSGNTANATIDAGAGIVTGVAGLSTPTISYTLPTGCLVTTTITVNQAPGAVSGSTSICEGSRTVLTVGGGGTWVSANPALADVTAGPTGGGVVTGIAAGNTGLTYTMPGTGCFSVTSVTVNPTPAAITGTPGICYGATTTLNNATPGGAWFSSDSMVAAVAGGVVYPLLTAGGTADISYVLSTGCKAVQEVTVHPLPIVYNLNQPSGITSYCAGGGGISLELNASVTGVNYQLFNGGISAGIAGGNGSVLSFGPQTDAGTYTAVGIDAVTGCRSNMTGSPVISINPLPTVYMLGVVGSSRYCDIPGAGVDVVLNNSDLGVEYTSFIDGIPGTGVYGTGSSVSFGLQTAEGVYTAIATDPVTRCTSNMSGSILVGKNPLPVVHNVIASDGGNYCAGTAGVHVGLDFGNTGIRYDLYEGVTLVSSVSGANSSVDFGVWPAGYYTVVGVNSITGCTNNMNGSALVTMLPLPALHNVQVIGRSSYCPGDAGAHVKLSGSDIGIDYQLYDGIAAQGVAVPGTGAALDYGLLPTGNYTIIGTDAATGCAVNMSGSALITMFPALSVFNSSVEAPGSYCAGDAGLHIYLSSSATGVKYDLRNGGAIVATRPGSGSKLDFGAQPAAGAYVVMATDANSCSAAMTGTPTVVINTLPTMHDVTVTNGGVYCAGSAGVNIGLNFSDAGISYQLYFGVTPIGSPVAGSNAALDFGTFTATGTYTVMAVNAVTGCMKTMNGTAVVKMSATPVAYNISGGGSYCAGSVTGVPVGLIKSTAGVNYQLFNGASMAGSVVAGTGAAISFGNQVATGLYTVVGTDAVTGCVNNMAGSKVITIDPLPIVYNVTGGGTNCAGGTGFHVGLSNSTPGIDYQLWNGSVPVATVPGSGRAIDYGVQSIAGTYTVFAKTVISGCSEDMSGSAVISFNPLPAVYTVAGGGSYCDGDAGAEVHMLASEPGVYYQLYEGAIATGSPVLGTGAKLSFGKMTAGSYTAVAYNAATGCSKNMSGAVTVNSNSLPAAYTVMGGGTMCAGAAGLHIYLTGSQSAVSYQLYQGSTAVGGAVAGTGVAVDFGALTAGGIYTVKAAHTITGCTNTMKSSGTIIVNAAPVAFDVTGGGNYCESGAGVAVGLAGSVPGMNYQLYNSATAVGMPVGGTGTTLTFGLQKGAGSYTVLATNTVTKCTADMTGSVPVVADPMVVPAVAISGTDGKACIGDVVNYKVSAVNGGTAPTYIWSIGGLPKGTGATFSTIPVIGDVVSVEMTSNAYCVSTPVAGTSVAMDMMPYVMPTATVNVTPGTAVCRGTQVSMSATTTEGGTAPGYSWLKNGVFVGASESYEDSATNDGDVFVFMLRSNLRCHMSDTVFSDPVVMSVDVADKPVFTIKSHIEASAIHVGSVDSFSVEFTRKPKGLLTYQWYVMGAMVPGATLPVFIDHNIYDNNVVSCEVRKVGACGNQSATAETIVHLKNLGTRNVASTANDISILPNPNKGEFTVKGTIGITNDEAVVLEITNMLGQVIYTGKTMTQNGGINERIALSNSLANGMYLLNIRSSAGNNVFHVVIEQ